MAEQGQGEANTADLTFSGCPWLVLDGSQRKSRARSEMEGKRRKSECVRPARIVRTGSRSASNGLIEVKTEEPR